MNIGFDLDGTLTEEKVRALAEYLFRAGHRIHVISAAMKHDEERAWEHKKEKLARIGAKYHELHLALCEVGDGKDKGQVKAKICRELDLIAYFDDEPETVEHMKDAGCPVFLIAQIGTVTQR